MKQIRAYFTIAILLTSICISGCSEEGKTFKQIEVGDVAQYGSSLIGKRVEYKGVIVRAYACQLPENRGNQCLEVYKDANKTPVGEGVIIKDGIYSLEQYKDWMENEKMVSLKGKVELRPAADRGYKENTMLPTFIADSIKAVN